MPLGIGNLKSIAQGLKNNKSIVIIEILDCPNVKVLPDDLHIADHLHQSKCPNLVNLAGLPRQKLITPLIVRCNKLKARPNWMHNLASLQKLTIHTRSSKRRICPTASGTREEGLLRLWLQLSHQPRWLSIDYEKIYKPLCWNFVMLFHDKHDYTSKVFRRDRRSIICVRIKRIIKKKKKNYFLRNMYKQTA